MSREPVSIAVKEPVRVCIASRSGRVTVIAEERDDLFAADGESIAEITRDESGQVSLSARRGSSRIELRCPLGASVRVGTISGSVEFRGLFSEIHVTTTSGSITLEQADAVDIRTVSGNISVKRCGRQCRLQTKTGRAEVGEAESAEVSTVSGRVSVDSASGAVKVKTATGRVEIGTAGKSDVAVQTLSGAVTVKVPKGIRPAALLRSLSGKFSCGCEEGNDCRVAVQTVSGKIDVVPG
jgi:DUF4097 and DUF4098 domain-containing protein YvlB